MTKEQKTEAIRISFEGMEEANNRIDNSNYGLIFQMLYNIFRIIYLMLISK